jgi:phage baseplate assembly protein W
MPAIGESRYFKDISLSFKRHPVTNDLISLTNEAAIKKSVRNLVETINGERPFNSLIGSAVRQSLFEPADSEVLFRLEQEITTSIENFEKRVRLTSVRASHPPDSNEITVDINYTIIGEVFPPQEVSFILQPTRQ